MSRTKFTSYDFTDQMKAHEFHAQALQFGPAKMRLVGGYPETWQVDVSARFDELVERQRAKGGSVREAIK